MQSLDAIGRLEHDVPVSRELAPEQGADILLIVDDEDDASRSAVGNGRLRGKRWAGEKLRPRGHPASVSCRRRPRPGP
jgi:hypothetical protein